MSFDRQKIDDYKKQHANQTKAELEQYLKTGSQEVHFQVAIRECIQDNEQEEKQIEYDQRERHHRRSVRVAWFAAAVAVVGAIAAILSAWYARAQVLSLSRPQVEQSQSSPVQR